MNIFMHNYFSLIALVFLSRSLRFKINFFIYILIIVLGKKIDQEKHFLLLSRMQRELRARNAF